MAATQLTKFFCTLLILLAGSFCPIAQAAVATLGNELPSSPTTSSNGEDAAANSSSIWKGTPMNALVQEFKTECLQQDDSVACIKLKVLTLLEDVLQKDSFKGSGMVSIIPNDKEPTSSASATKANSEQTESRSSNEDGFVEHLGKYIEKHDLLIKTPKEAFLGGATFRISPRNLDDNEINLSVRVPDDSADTNEVSSRGKKHKLKKILIPIMVFVLLKAMTLIPLAIGVLSLKAFNALKLSFISFLVSISLAIFQLFKKVAVDPPSSSISAHIPFDSYPSHYAAAAAAARNFYVEPPAAVAATFDQNTPGQSAVVDNSQNTPYRGYANNGAAHETS